MTKQSKLKKPISKLLSTALLLTTILSPITTNPQHSHASTGDTTGEIVPLKDLDIGDLVYDPTLSSAEGGQMKFEVVDKNYYDASGVRGTPSNDNTPGYGIALLAQNLIPGIQFEGTTYGEGTPKNGNIKMDSSNNNNISKSNSAMPYLNGTFLDNNFSAYTKGQMLDIPYHHTGSNSDPEKYKHKISLPSATELGATHSNIEDGEGDKINTNSDAKTFKAWKGSSGTANPGKTRIKKIGGTNNHYWTRTPNSNNSNYVWCVDSYGSVSNSIASNSSIGLAPLLNLKSDTRVKRVGQTSDNPAVYEIVETPPLQAPTITGDTTNPEQTSVEVTIKFTNPNNKWEYSTNNGQTYKEITVNKDINKSITITIHKDTTIIAKETDSTTGETAEKTLTITDLAIPTPTFGTQTQTQNLTGIGNVTITIPVNDINELGKPTTTILTREFITNGSQIVTHPEIDVPTVITVTGIDRSPTLILSNEGVITATNILTGTPYENTEANKIRYKIGDSGAWLEYESNNQPKLALHETAVFKIYDKYNIPWTSTITNTPTTLNAPVFKQQIDGWTKHPHKTLILHDGIKSSGLKYRVKNTDNDNETYVTIPEDKTQSTPKSDEQGWVIYKSIGPKILEVPVSEQGQTVEVILLDSKGNPTKDTDKPAEDEIYQHTVSNIDIESPKIDIKTEK